MTRLLAALMLSLTLILSFVLPSAAQADGFCPVSATITDITLPVTDIISTSATFNGRTCETLVFESNPEELLAQGGMMVPLVFEYGTTPGVYPIKVDADLISDTFNVTQTPDGAFVLQECFVWKAAVRDLHPCSNYYVRLRVIDEYFYISAARPAGKTAVTVAGKPLGQISGDGCPDPTFGVYRAMPVTFRTAGCLIGPVGGGSSDSGNTNVLTPSGPVPMANIVVQSASITTPKVGPGNPVDVSVSVANKGTVNGDAKVTLYVNGEQMESRGVTVASGKTAPVNFQVRRNEPGTYNVYVDGVSAGSFTVDTFADNDIPIYGIIALFVIGIGGVLYLVTRRRTA